MEDAVINKLMYQYFIIRIIRIIRLSAPCLAALLVLCLLPETLHSQLLFGRQYTYTHKLMLTIDTSATTATGKSASAVQVAAILLEAGSDKQVIEAIMKEVKTGTLALDGGQIGSSLNVDYLHLLSERALPFRMTMMLLNKEGKTIETWTREHILLTDIRSLQEAPHESVVKGAGEARIIKFRFDKGYIE
jgi:hypothetical protein